MAFIYLFFNIEHTLFLIKNIWGKREKRRRVRHKKNPKERNRKIHTLKHTETSSDRAALTNTPVLLIYLECFLKNVKNNLRFFYDQRFTWVERGKW